jgi:hypothetical protein
MKKVLEVGQEIRHTTRQGKLMIGKVVKQDGANVYMQYGNDIYKFHISDVSLAQNTKSNSVKSNKMIMLGWDEKYIGKEGRKWVVIYSFNWERYEKINKI